MSQSIHVEQLTKRFENVEAVANISFSVRQGELFGFLGPNGAGKTTTINMLTGLARPDSGTVQIGGIDCTRNPKAAQHLIGVVPDESNLYPELTGFENLSFCAALYGMRKNQRQSRAHELLSTFGLTEAGDRKFAGYSKGMKRKLTIAAGIIHQPRILFLDEPTTGIDVASARQIRQLIADLHHTGTTVFLKPVSYCFPLTYGVDILHGAFHGNHVMPFLTDFLALTAFCVVLFLISLRNIGRRWIL